MSTRIQYKSYSPPELSRQIKPWRRANSALLLIMPVLQVAETPMTTAQIAKRANKSIDKTRMAIARIYKMDLLKHSWAEMSATIKGDISPNRESLWELKSLDEVGVK